MMLKTSEVVKTPSVERLLNLWAKRYVPELSLVSLNNSSSYGSLLQASSPQGRALTANKLKDSILNSNCQMALIQAKSIYSYIPNILDLNEARRITQFAFRVYKKLLQIYLIQSGTDASSTVWGILAIADLAYALEPILMVFQEQHIASKDWRALGFMTTQLNFTNRLIEKKLTPDEKVLFAPYLKFVEEQVAIPWQRVCATAAKYELGSPELNLVEQMMPASHEIAKTVFHKLLELVPNHRSRRGELKEANVTHSCLRDLNMFQAYIWLCFLNQSIEPLEKELLPLCVMVVEGVGIKWELTEKWCEVLAVEMESRVTQEQKVMLQPYTQGMCEVFWKGRDRLGFGI
jgi:Phycobilisome protein